MARLKAVIVGAGLIAQKKHVPAFLRQRASVGLAAVCDLNFPAAQKLAASAGIPNAYSDLGEMLRREKPDLVDICTPPQTHAKLATQAMRQGCHVFIEKPMALTVEECDEILTTSEACRVKATVAHSDLFYPPFLKARELVGKGMIGEFRGMRIFLATPTVYMTAHKDHWAHTLPGGVIGETGPHVVYMSLAYINPVREVSVHAMKHLDYPWSQFDDYRIDLIGENGISSITLSYASDQWLARVDIVGSKGILMLDLEGMCIVRYQRPELKPFPVGLSLVSEAGQIMRNIMSNGIRFATRRLRSTHDVLIQRVLDSIVKGTEPPVTAKEGREAVRVMNVIGDQLKEKYG